MSNKHTDKYDSVISSLLVEIDKLMVDSIELDKVAKQLTNHIKQFNYNVCDNQEQTATGLNKQRALNIVCKSSTEVTPIDNYIIALKKAIANSISPVESVEAIEYLINLSIREAINTYNQVCKFNEWYSLNRDVLSDIKSSDIQFSIVDIGI